MNTPTPNAEAGHSHTGKSLEDVHGSVAVPKGMGFWRKMFVFAGPGFLVAVGYMDPGNWATDIAGGSKFGYQLLSIVFISNLMAILLQSLSAKLGIVSGRDLAQACSDHYSKPVSVVLWLLCEMAIAACDLAEVIGSAIALNLLFHLPLLWGVCLTAFDVFIIMYLQNKGFRYMEALVVGVVLIIAICFGLELYYARPNAMDVAAGFIPTSSLITNPEMLYLAIGILGATVMPHNLYLHSSIVQTRRFDPTPAGKREALGFAVFDSTFALIFAFFINAAILVMAAATFHAHGKYDVDDIRVAHEFLTPLLGSAASVLFAVALLASGQNSTLTGTLAGQIVMEGFLNLRMRPWVRRFITRAIALAPAIAVTAYYAKGTMDEQFEAIGRLLVFSQVVLSLQLGFAVIPLIQFTSSRKLMGEFVNSLGTKILAWIAAGIIVVLNLKYVADFIGLTK
jgi:manganese transport protein